MIKRKQSTDSIETYAYGMSKDLLCKKEKTQCNNIIKQQFTFDHITKQDIKKHIQISQKFLTIHAEY